VLKLGQSGAKGPARCGKRFAQIRLNQPLPGGQITRQNGLTDGINNGGLNLAFGLECFVGHDGSDLWVLGKVIQYCSSILCKLPYVFAQNGPSNASGFVMAQRLW
jgi:hypothetical protein